MRDVMFEIPSNPKIVKCTITKETVDEKAKPEIEISENEIANEVSKNSKKAKRKNERDEESQTA